MRRKIKWNTVFFWSMILVLAFLIWNQKTIIREGFREGAGKCRVFGKKEYKKIFKTTDTWAKTDKTCRKKGTSVDSCVEYRDKRGGFHASPNQSVGKGYACCWHYDGSTGGTVRRSGSSGLNLNSKEGRKACQDGTTQTETKTATKSTSGEGSDFDHTEAGWCAEKLKFTDKKTVRSNCRSSGNQSDWNTVKSKRWIPAHKKKARNCKNMDGRKGSLTHDGSESGKAAFKKAGGDLDEGTCCWYPWAMRTAFNTYATKKSKADAKKTGEKAVQIDEIPIPKHLYNKYATSSICNPTVTKAAAAVTKAAPAETTKKATISPAKVKGKSGPIPKATTGTDKRGKTVKAAAGGGSGGIDVDYKKGAKWKIAVGKNSNSLEFNYDGKPMVSIGSDGQIRGKKCSCGKWNLRDNRMGIPGRNDINLHTDGWARMLKYDTGADLSSHTTADYKQGGFAGQKLYYLKGGKTGVALS